MLCESGSAFSTRRTIGGAGRVFFFNFNYFFIIIKSIFFLLSYCASDVISVDGCSSSEYGLNNTHVLYMSVFFVNLFVRSIIS